MATQRITFLKVPVDIVSPEDLDAIVLDLLSREGPQHIMLVNLWDVLRARRRGEYRTMVQSASLVLPTSRSLIRGIRFLHKKNACRYNPFHFVIQMLGILERYRKSVYLLGAHQRSLLQAERNVRSTYPGLSLVGRFPGYYHRSMEQRILTAIIKANPSLVLAGSGIPGRQRWVWRNRNRFKSGLFYWSGDVIDIFSDRKRRVSEALFNRGLEYVPQIMKNPLRFFRLFQYMYYNLLLVLYRLFRPSS